MIQHHHCENISLDQILDTFSHKQKVNFALYCSKEIEHFTNDQRVIACNQIVKQWLKGDQTVDLELARTNAWNAANAAWYTANAAWYTANAAYYAAYAAANAAANAAYANAAYCAAWRAARAKSYNLYPNNETQRNVAYKQFFKEYKQIAQNWLSHWIIPDFPKDELDFPIFDFLQDFNLIQYLLPKKEDYYYLNLNGFNTKHENEMELLKLIDTNHIKTILRRIINNDLS